MALRRELETLQRLTVEVQNDLLGALDEGEALRDLEIDLLAVFVVERLERQIEFPEALVGYVLVEHPHRWHS